MLKGAVNTAQCTKDERCSPEFDGAWKSSLCIPIMESKSMSGGNRAPVIVLQALNKIGRPGTFCSEDALLLSLLGKATCQVLSLARFLTSVDAHLDRGSVLMQLALKMMAQTDLFGASASPGGGGGSAQKFTFQGNAAQAASNSGEEQVGHLLSEKFQTLPERIHFKGPVEQQFLWVLNFLEEGLTKMFPMIGEGAVCLHLAYGDHTRLVVKEMGRVVFIATEKSDGASRSLAEGGQQRAHSSVSWVVANRKATSCHPERPNSMFAPPDLPLPEGASAGAAADALMVLHSVPLMEGSLVGSAAPNYGGPVGYLHSHTKKQTAPYTLSVEGRPKCPPPNSLRRNPEISFCVRPQTFSNKRAKLAPDNSFAQVSAICQFYCPAEAPSGDHTATQMCYNPREADHHERLSLLLQFIQSAIRLYAPLSERIRAMAFRKASLAVGAILSIKRLRGQKTNKVVLED